MTRQPRSALRSLDGRDLLAAGIGVLGATLGLWLGAWLAPGEQVKSVWQVVIGGVLVGIGGQWLVVWLVLYPSAVAGWEAFWWSVITAWLVAAVSTVLVWLA